MDWWQFEQQELIKILYDDSTGFKYADDNDDFHRRRQRQTFNMSDAWMRISFEHLQKIGTFIKLVCSNVKLYPTKNETHHLELFNSQENHK